MVELQPPLTPTEPSEFATDENSYQAKARRRNLVDENGNYINSNNPFPITSGFSLPEYDYVGVSYPNSTTETYMFKLGGSGGTLMSTITLVYSDSTKSSLVSATKT